MGVTIAQQTWQFFSALLFGAALGVYYDLFRILRVAFPPGRVVAFVEDLFWWGSAGVLTVLFGIAGLGGQLRLFALLGEGIGFLLYHLTIGAAVMHLARWLIGLIYALLRLLFRLTLAPVFRLIGRLWRFVGSCLRKMGILAKKSLRKRKFRLKRDRVLLYNLLIGSGQGKNGKGVGPHS